MFDWYLLLTSVFGLLIMLTLISLKYAFKITSQSNIQILAEIKQEKKEKQSENRESSIFERSKLLKTYSYLMRNYSLLEFCFVNKAKNKLPMLMTIFLISLLCFLFPSIFVFSFVGIPIVVVFLIIESCSEEDPIDQFKSSEFNLQAVKEGDERKNRFKAKNRRLYAIMGILICGLGLLMCAITFKNYYNSVLSVLAFHILVNLIANFFIVKPLAFLVLSFILKFNLLIQVHIEHQNLREQLRNVSVNSVKNFAVTLSPKKNKSKSPTKIPKALFNKTNGESAGICSAIENLKKIKKQKLSVPQLMTPVSKRNGGQNSDYVSELQDYTLNNLLFEVERQVKESSVKKFNFDEDNERINQNLKSSKRRDSELVIVEFNNSQKQNYQASEKGDEANQSPIKPNFIHSNLDMNDIADYQGEDNQTNIIQLINANRPESVQNSMNEDQDGDEHEDEETIQRNQHMTLQEKNNLLSFHEQGDKEIEEIDLNSPIRRRIQENSTYDAKIRKKAKHYNSNLKKRTIKFTSGQPYLEYLPKMLNKQFSKHTKKSQPINFKNDLSPAENEVNVRGRKSLNKIKGSKDHKMMFRDDENYCPQAISIEDL